MDVIHSGYGARTEAWLDLVRRRTGATSVAVVGESQLPGNSGVEHYPTLAAALENETAQLVVASGMDAVSRAAEALEAGLWVVLDEPGRADPSAVAALHEKAAATGRLMTRCGAHTYSRCERMMRRFLDSGRLGSIGHVACSDRHTVAVADPLLTAYRHFDDATRLLGVEPRTVMARLRSGPDGRAMVEAYLEMSEGIHIHYSAVSGAQANAHSLWIEGSAGSLRTDGARVWWRKQGWPVFVPVRVSLFGAGATDDPGGALKTMTRAVNGAGIAESDASLRGIAMAAAALESAAAGAPVSVQGG